MKVAVLFISVGFLVSVVWGKAFSWASWEDIGKEIRQVNWVIVDKQDPRVIVLASAKGIFKSKDRGESWEKVLSLKGQNTSINYLIADAANSGIIFAATGSGLYRSNNLGETWKRVFRGKNAFENECTSVCLFGSGIYAGTRGGLFASEDLGRSWKKESGEIGSSHVLSLCADEKKSGLYAACVEGVFRFEAEEDRWERIFIVKPTEDGEESEATEEDSDEEETYSRIRYLESDKNNPGFLYLATSRGIYRSTDRGISWEPLSGYGLLDRDIRSLLHTRDGRLFAAAKGGVFEYKQERWEELTFGLSCGGVNSLSLDSGGFLYAAGGNGLFRTNLKEEVTLRAGGVQSTEADEPDIRLVQKAAISYAEVAPEKIALWRKQAAKKAFLPKLSVSMDRDIDKTTSSNIWGTYSSGSAVGRHYCGPDDTTRYNNWNWGVSLSWDLSDIIWSDDQTNIDVRSRLMVQLRNDILDEVNKTYFEYIRVKAELNSLNIEERKKRLEKELRLRELAASLDALTGDFFSRSRGKLN